jgi:hypothetical protein
MPVEPNVPNELEDVVALAELVQYQPGAVVSRTIVKKPVGTVTAFAFDQGEGLSEHTAPFDALVILIEGEAEISIAGVPHRVAAGQLLRLPAGPMLSKRSLGSRCSWSWSRHRQDVEKVRQLCSRVIYQELSVISIQFSVSGTDD